MKKFIFLERNGIYIIDLQKTLKCLNEARTRSSVRRRRRPHPVRGHKRQAKTVISEEAVARASSSSSSAGSVAC